MALSLKDAETDRLAREVSKLTGESLTEAVRKALAAYELPEPFHKDPADRLIVAMARLLQAPVVTVDRRILAYGQQGHVQVLAY